MPRHVIDVLRRFIPEFRSSRPILHEAQHRALWAITHCRTAMMGGHLYVCEDCGKSVYAYHSCNHRSCPLCGKSDTAQWVERELEKRVNAPYFMVTFTLPSELRDLFFGKLAKQAFDLFFAASSAALSEKLASKRWLGAKRSGFTGVLHTWNQQLQFHPHIHYIVPGGGLDAKDRFMRVKNANFLVPVRVLSGAFRASFRAHLAALGWEVDPAVWRKDWGVDIRPFGSGANAIKYLGAYVCRTAIGDSRIVAMDDQTVSFSWKDRAHSGRQRVSKIAGIEFIARYLRHVLPRGMRSIRYFGFCHPAAKRTRERV
ncbi:MAG: transposase, partial [Cyanobacteria bacterium J06648_11]